MKLIKDSHRKELLCIKFRSDIDITKNSLEHCPEDDLVF